MSVPQTFQEAGSMNKLIFSTDPFFRNLGAEWAANYFITVDMFVTAKAFKVSFFVREEKEAKGYIPHNIESE